MATDTFDWDRISKHLQDIKNEYASIGVSGNFGLIYTIIPLETRLAKGERSRELYEEIMALE